MALRVAINGFGRIGRSVLRAAIKEKGIEFVAINDLTDAKTLAHLLKYDSVHGPFPGKVEAGNGEIIVNGKPIKILAVRNPEELPWKKEKIDVVLESTGLFTSREKAELHLKAGAKKVIISAPATNEDITIVMGVNSNLYDPKKHNIISNASCTTNCLAPVAKVLHETFGIEKGLVTTVHSYTNDQQILDLPHKDLRRARAASMSMIPTSTGAAKAVSLVLPELKGKLDGMAIRVPTPNVSVVDLVVTLSKKADADKVNAALKKASKGSLKGVLGFSEEPLVSIDFNGNALSSVVDAGCTKVIEGNMVKVLSWYDNETGFSHRVVDLMKLIAQ
ncbi:type I glyceraldehyde-3-phosphate dehydrogenase [Geobacter hydrogenophilus]|uniref:Glyceraldehyde-3-phosphate dehydrogenase n=1 Tax=Geobacter hydrogenophilus TaxID=40983 RepID=A0A9W6FXE3_9BACT|nr:type I glyceraldehyde-3-phosphate dehydrogenase [Geobacter hydrogenophilus]MBT0895245.1 type I glyceraldehyde-3-phosphate dehydrogenase [Geobacter hydrogenophilus]GLI36573.1 glyceraldehyde-3-phosphate dehydrogenase [Geobacter hydrogenophilus]